MKLEQQKKEFVLFRRHVIFKATKTKTSFLVSLRFVKYERHTSIPDVYRLNAVRKIRRSGPRGTTLRKS